MDFFDVHRQRDGFPYVVHGRKRTTLFLDRTARKEVLENLVIQALQKKLSDPKTIDEMVKGIII